MKFKTTLAIIMILLGIAVVVYNPQQLVTFLSYSLLSVVGCLLAYGLGSIPFGLILTKIFLRKDVRELGSGNTGATNVMRTGNYGLALTTLVLDAGKGALAVWYLPPCLMLLDLPAASLVVAGFAILGHIFPVWLNGKGGKGIATAFGAFTILSWPVALSALATWLLIAFLTRYSSLAAMVAIGLTPVYAYLFNEMIYTLFALGLGIVIFYCHRNNIKRLIQGRESKIGSSGAKDK